MRHLLKYQFQEQKRSNSSLFTIREHRNCPDNRPSLKMYCQDILSNRYQDARKLAADETGLDLNIFPENCPYLSENILDVNYLTE